MSSPYIETSDHDNLRTLGKIVLFLFLIVAVGLLFWGILRAQTILARNDNPRLLEQELRIRRGTILDRRDNILAFNEGGTGRLQRRYPLPNIGPAVGFYSVLHGTAGAEDGFDEFLRNDPVQWRESVLRDSLHLIQEGQNVKLSIDAELQLEADAALDQRRGAVLVLELDPNMAARVGVRTLVSHPSYNPNVLDDQFDILGANENAPLLNRVTQGQYQPGLLLQPFIFAAAVDQGLLNMNDLVTEPDQEVKINGANLNCNTSPPDSATWSDVLQHQCPGPMLALSDQLGIGGLDTIFSAFGLDRNPLFELDTSTTPDEPLSDPLLAGIGQDNLSITPLQIGLALSAFANGGVIRQPQIGMAIQDEEGDWRSWNIDSISEQATTANAAAIILQALPQKNNVYEHNPLVLSGPDETINAWYTAILDQAGTDYVIVVVVEDSKLEDEATYIGRRVLSAIRKIEQRENDGK